MVVTSRSNHTKRRKKGKDLGDHTWTYEDAIKQIDDVQLGQCYWHPRQVLSFVPGTSWRCSTDRLNPTSVSYTADNVVICGQEFNVRRTWSRNKIEHMLAALAQDQLVSDTDRMSVLTTALQKPPHVSKRHWCRNTDHTRKRSRRGGCQTCETARQKEIRETPYGFLSSLVNSTGQHKLAPVDFDRKSFFSQMLSLAMSQMGRCHISNMPMEFHYNVDWQASIERVNPRLPYSIDNCVIICLEFNSACNQIKHEEFVPGMDSQWTRDKFTQWKIALENRHTHWAGIDERKKRVFGVADAV